jgi:FkbM family methyltransferase
MKIFIVDTLGLTYDGSTLDKRGLGGSESAVILMSKELVKIGVQVTVFNDCESDDSKPGFYDGVEYIPLREINNIDRCIYDVGIASRSVAAFAPKEIKDRFKTFSFMPDFEDLMSRTRHKVLWMHDTFCDGDDLIEDFVLQGRINEIFTLSDWHTGYVTHCDHGKRRNFDILKNHIFVTRNGIGKMNPGWVDIKDKDPNLFVFNASVTKGMVSLVNDIWPRVKQRIPDAKLKVIGGYYRFRSDHGPDEQELDWRRMVKENPDIDFTGIIPQKDISDILRKASFMIYPVGFPETFGISTLEALAHNVPLITCRFGALEETAIDDASYKIPYPVEPNWALQWLDRDHQVEVFTEAVMYAYDNKYIHQQKMYACNKVKDICGWDTVALQWKQHFYRISGNFLPVSEHQKVTLINNRVREVFGRRFMNKEEVLQPAMAPFNQIYIVTPVYNAESYIGRCIDSVAQQDYQYYKMIIIDDASTDSTVAAIEEKIKLLPKDVRNKFVLYKNKVNLGAVCNQVTTIMSDCLEQDGIVMLLDGDDWLVNNPGIFNKYNTLYNQGAEFTYGSCWSVVDGIPLVAQEYPPDVKVSRSYRQYKFNWNMPYTHLRTFRGRAFHKHVDENGFIAFKDTGGNWLKAGGDTAVFYAMIEQADPNNVVCVSDIVYNYNDANPINDYKVNSDEQTRTANMILGSKASSKKISVVMPTMWRCADVTKMELMNIVSHELVDQIIIIDNDPEKRPNSDILNHEKITIYPMKKNIGVNPAWNMGVKLAKNDIICIANDDIVFDPRLFNKLVDRITPESGPHGIINGDASLGQPATTDGNISFIDWKPGDIIHCFGQLMFVHKSSWIDIPEELVIAFGDDWIMHTHLRQNKVPVMIYNTHFYSPMSQTVTDKTIELIADETRFEREAKAYNRLTVESHSVEIKPVQTKRILIAIPTARYIEPDTFKSIYDLEVPDGYVTDFHYFYGYRVDQIRNLIADWAVRGYDYLFAVDHDVTFPPDTLKKLLSHDKDVVSGVYRQRLPVQAIEIYDLDQRRMDISQLIGRKLVQIGGCGFGCVLVKKEVMESVGYPQFEYHVALDHRNTISEDTDFCRKAMNKGFTLWCDPSILCGHIGSTTMSVELPDTVVAFNMIETRLRELRSMDLMPKEHVNYLQSMNRDGTSPKVIYDIGSSVLHWTDKAKQIWPSSEFFLLEAMSEVEPIYKESGHRYHLGVLSDKDGKIVEFYQNLEHPGGNSYYRENPEHSPAAPTLFSDGHKVIKKTSTLDSIRTTNGWPYPDMIKIDVQGAELDVLAGARDTLSHCKDVIIEIQNVEYNIGGAERQKVIDFMTEMGFVNLMPICGNHIDGDWHFRK